MLYSERNTLALVSQAASKPVRQVFCNYMKNGFGSCGVLLTLERQKRCLCMPMNVYHEQRNKLKNCKRLEYPRIKVFQVISPKFRDHNLNHNPPAVLSIHYPNTTSISIQAVCSCTLSRFVLNSVRFLPKSWRSVKIFAKHALSNIFRKNPGVVKGGEHKLKIDPTSISSVTQPHPNPFSLTTS